MRTLAVSDEARLRALQGAIALLLINQADSKSRTKWLEDQLTELIRLNADLEQRVQYSDKLQAEQKEAICKELRQVHSALEDIFDDAQLMLKQRENPTVKEMIR